MKIVPTTYIDKKGTSLVTNQYSVTEQMKETQLTGQQSLPGVFVFYDLSPIKVQFTEKRGTFLHCEI